jgi:hypothetical protein
MQITCEILSPENYSLKGGTQNLENTAQELASFDDEMAKYYEQNMLTTSFLGADANTK